MIYITLSQKTIFLFMCRILHFLYHVQYHINMLFWGGYCFWDAKTLLDTYILMFNTFVAALLLCLVTRTYFKAKKVLNDGVLKFYYLMMCWGVLFIGKNLFSILVFFNDFLPNRQHIDEQWMCQRINLYSKIYQLLDLLPQMIIQTLLLLIPLHILGKMLEYRLLNDEKTKKWYRAGNTYFKVRLLIIVPSIAVFFPIDNLWIVEILSELKGLFIVLDGMICLILLLFRRKSILKEYQPLNADFVQTLKRELRLLAFSLILRVILSTLNYLLFQMLISAFFNSISFQYFCVFPSRLYHGNLLYTTFDILLADFLTHFLPIIVIVRMYKPPSR